MYYLKKRSVDVIAVVGGGVAVVAVIVVAVVVVVVGGVGEKKWLLNDRKTRNRSRSLSRMDPEPEALNEKDEKNRQSGLSLFFISTSVLKWHKIHSKVSYILYIGIQPIKLCL